MIPLGTALAVGVVWRDALRPPRAPVHLLSGAGVWDAAPPLTLAALWVARWIVPLQADSWASSSALIALAAVIGKASAAPGPNHAPLLADALWLLVGATLAADASTTGVAAGFGAGLLSTGAVLGVQWAAWGRSPRFAQSWRPWFRVHCDNPDVAGATARIAGGTWDVEIAAAGAWRTSITVHRPGHQRVAALDTAELAPFLAEHGRVTVRLGATRGQADVALPVPDGRLMVTVRQYGVDRRAWTPPRIVEVA